MDIILGDLTDEMSGQCGADIQQGLWMRSESQLLAGFVRVLWLLALFDCSGAAISGSDTIAYGWHYDVFEQQHGGRWVFTKRRIRHVWTKEKGFI